MKLVLDLDTDSNYIYIMDKDYDGRTKDLLSFEFLEDKKDRERIYHLKMMPRPIADGKLRVLGVDII